MITPISYLAAPRRLASLFLFFGSFSALLVGARAENGPTLPFLSPIFSDHMVLQRNKPNQFWGWTEPGQTVTVEINGNSAKAVADASGKWNATVTVPPPGGPYSATISGSQKVILTDVLVGDVWLCGGQSNMGIALSGSTGGKEAALLANSDKLRFCTVAARNGYVPAAVPVCKWSLATPETAPGFSAVAYYFAQRLQQDVQIPIGLIQDCVGGSPVESWMSAASLTKLGEFTPQLVEIQRLRKNGGEIFGSFLMQWLDEHDAGGKNAAWAQSDLDDSNWKPVQLKRGFEILGVPDSPAVCWFRRTITLPPNAPTAGAKIFLGVVEKMDTTYVNGRWVGASSWVENPRAYTLPADLLHAGKNTIAIRVFKTKANGGFQSAPEMLRLQLSDGTNLPLDDDWLGRLSIDARPPFPWPLNLENYTTMPTALSNGMITPLAPLAIAGVLWYQGEANQTRPNQYAKLLPGLIRDWREQFAQGDLPFYIASLPAFMARRTEPSTDGWTEIREVQLKAVDALLNVGTAVTIDTGDANDIHPKEKRIVGERLALLALAGHYHRQVAASGPIFRSLEKKGKSLRVRFHPIDGSLAVKGKSLEEFALAGADQKWHWATAQIDGNTVIVSSPEVSEPVAVRYAWQANPSATLFSNTGLPAAPFRSDNWPLEPDR